MVPKLEDRLENPVSRIRTLELQTAARLRELAESLSKDDGPADLESVIAGMKCLAFEISSLALDLEINR
jgi:hypothetical protein